MVRFPLKILQIKNINGIYMQHRWSFKKVIMINVIFIFPQTNQHDKLKKQMCGINQINNIIEKTKCEENYDNSPSV